MSGLVHAQEVLKGVPGLSFVMFSGRDVVRHELVSQIVQAYDQADRNNHHARQSPAT